MMSVRLVVNVSSITVETRMKKLRFFLSLLDRPRFLIRGLVLFIYRCKRAPITIGEQNYLGKLRATKAHFGASSLLSLAEVVFLAMILIVLFQSNITYYTSLLGIC